MKRNRESGATIIETRLKLHTIRSDLAESMEHDMGVPYSCALVVLAYSAGFRSILHIWQTFTNASNSNLFTKAEEKQMWLL